MDCMEYTEHICRLNQSGLGFTINWSVLRFYFLYDGSLQVHVGNKKMALMTSVYLSYSLALNVFCLLIAVLFNARLLHSSFSSSS